MSHVIWPKILWFVYSYYLIWFKMHNKRIILNILGKSFENQKLHYIATIWAEFDSPSSILHGLYLFSHLTKNKTLILSKSHLRPTSIFQGSWLFFLVEYWSKEGEKNSLKDQKCSWLLDFTFGVWFVAEKGKTQFCSSIRF